MSETRPDDAWMGEALDLAKSVRTTTSPNPWVGCVIVPAGDEPAAEGATQPPGGPHAEAVALSLAGASARGATAYVTLEPCAHHGRTPPCADALIAAGVARVVVAIADPDPRVAGQGIRRLRDAGVTVDVGVGEAEATSLLAPYLEQRRTGRPWVVLKLAVTLDGRIAAPDGTSKWITGPAARLDVQALRAESDAIAVGAGTVRADDPALTVRVEADPAVSSPWQPAFSLGRPASSLGQPASALGQPASSPGQPASRVPHPGRPPSSVIGAATPGLGEPRQPLRVVLGAAPAGARVRPALEHNGPLPALLDELGRRGVLQLLVEGGAHVAHAFHRAGLVHRYVFYVAPALLGGDDGVPVLAGPGAPTLASAWRGRLLDVRRLGDDVRLDVEGPAADGQVWPEPGSTP